MLVGVIVICAIGLIATLLPATSAYSAYLVRSTTRSAGVDVPVDQLPALQVRARRRAQGAGFGVLVGGVVLLVVVLLWPEGREQPTGGYVVFSVLAVCSGAGLALVEILRPGDVAEGPRWARSIAPTLDDYVPPWARVLQRVLVGVGLGALGGTLLLTQSRWFDAPAIWRSPAVFLLAAVPLLVLLSRLASRRVLDAPQPARDAQELYWQDAWRANTLSTLTAIPALVSMAALLVSGAALDEAASTAAVASGQLGPAWTQWLLIGGYVLPMLLLFVAGCVALAASAGGVEAVHFRRRLWPADGPVDAGTGER